MATPCGLMMFALQSTYEVNGRDIHLIMISCVVVAAVVLLLMLGILIAGLVALGYVKKLTSMLDDLHQKIVPLVSKSTDLVDDLGPKIRSISSNVEEISFTARAKADEVGQTITQINRTVSDITAKTQVQANRVDVIVTDALATTKQVSESVQQGIRAPIKQVAGVIAGLKAALQTLAERSPLKPRGSTGTGTRYDL